MSSKENKMEQYKSIRAKDLPTTIQIDNCKVKIQKDIKPYTGQYRVSLTTLTCKRIGKILINAGQKEKEQVLDDFEWTYYEEEDTEQEVIDNLKNTYYYTFPEVKDWIRILEKHLPAGSIQKCKACGRDV